jgi:hypothetical protein
LHIGAGIFSVPQKPTFNGRVQALIPTGNFWKVLGKADMRIAVFYVTQLKYWARLSLDCVNMT